MIAAPPDRTREAAAKNAAAADVVHSYARDVVEGGIVANRYVRLLCARHLRWLEREDLHFDAAKAGRAIRFFGLLKLHEGQFEGKPFVLQPWQAFIIGSIFGWYTRDQESGEWIRLTRNAFVETGKGSGKSPMAAGVGGYGMTGEGRSGASVFSAAPSRFQSAIAWTDFKNMVAKSDALRTRVQTFAHSLVGPKGSTFQYASSEAKNLHGPRVYIAIIDEEHAHPGPEVIDAMRAGTKAWVDALIFRITNSGFDRHSVCWADHEYSVNVLEGVIEDDSWFGFICGLDMCEEHRAGGAPVDGCPNCDQWTDEAVWPKANPNLGVTISRQYLREMVREAIGKPSQRNIVKRLNFCIWTEGSGKWLDVAAFRECADPLEATVSGGYLVGAGVPLEELRRSTPLPGSRRGYGGLDLSSTIDLSAYAFVAPRAACGREGHAGRCYDLRVRFYLPADNLPERVKRDHVPYDVWTRAGWITLTPGNRIDRRWILRDVVAMRDQLIALGYDRWGMDEMIRDLQEAGFDRDTEGFLEPVGQGYAGLSAPCKTLEADIAGRFVHTDGNPVLAWNVANAIADEDPAGNIKPDKAKSAEKIDGVSAWADALFAMAAVPPEAEEESVYETRGIRTVRGLAR